MLTPGPSKHQENSAKKSTSAPRDDDEIFDPALYLIQREPTNLGAAQRLADAGLHVFPCDETKRPLGGLKWKDRSTRDQAQIERWWDGKPNSLAAIDCGKNKLVVIDCDRHGEHDGVAAFDALIDEHGLPEDAPIVFTPNDGLHFYFRQPDEGKPLGNSKGSLPLGIDVRGDGGYVIAPGATLPDGRQWSGVDGAPELDEAFQWDDIPVIPNWLVDLIRAPKQRDDLQPQEPRHTPTPAPGSDDPGLLAWARAALKGCSDSLAAEGKGGRNEALNKAAFRLGSISAHGLLTRQEAYSALRESGIANGMVREDGRVQFSKTFNSGFEAGLRSPCDLPEREEDREIQALADEMWRSLQEGGRKIVEDAEGNLIDTETGEQPNRDHLLTKAWIRREFPPRDYLMGELLCTTSRWLLIGETGVGKTLFCLDLAGAIAAGVGFVNWDGRRRARVMYLDGEMPAETFKERKEIIAERYGEDIEVYGYNRDDLGDNAMPPLNTPAGQKWLWQEINIVKPDIIFFDNIMCLTVGDMKDDMSWEPVKPLIRNITSRRIAQVWMHHTGHDSSKGFGTKTREWEMDTVVMLTKNKDGGYGDNVSINLQFDKARLRTPSTAEQFMPKLLTCGDDGWSAETTGATVNVSKDTYDAAMLKNEIMKSYDALASGENAESGVLDPSRRVSVDAIRDDLARRGILERKEQFGPITPTARTRFHRAKLGLIQTRKFVEDNGMICRADFPNSK
jgi:hypothetical protein